MRSRSGIPEDPLRRRVEEALGPATLATLEARAGSGPGPAFALACARSALEYSARGAGAARDAAAALLRLYPGPQPGARAWEGEPPGDALARLSRGGGSWAARAKAALAWRALGDGDAARAEALARGVPGREAALARATALLRAGRWKECLAARGDGPEFAALRQVALQSLRAGGAAVGAARERRGLAGVPALRLRAERLLLGGRHAEAARAYRALAARGGGVEAALGEAEALLAGGRAAAALALLGRARAADAEGRWRLALARWDCPAARDAAEEILARDPAAGERLARPVLLLFERRPRAGWPPEYARACRRGLARLKAGPWKDWFARLAAARLGVGAPRARGARPPARLAWMGYAAGLESLTAGRLAPARRAFAGASRAGEWRSACHLGELEAIAGRPAGARAAFDRARALAPERARAGVEAWRAEVLLWLGRPREALAALDQASRLGAERLSPCWRGAALLLLGRAAEAERRLARAAADDPRDAEAALFLAEARLARGRARAALAALKGVPEGDPFRLVFEGLAREALGRRGAAEAARARLPAAWRAVARGRGAGALRRLLAAARGCRRSGYESLAWTRGPSPATLIRG